MMKKNILYEFECPNCGVKRLLKYKAYRRAVKYGRYCKLCSPKNIDGLEKGHGWNKGLTGTVKHTDKWKKEHSQRMSGSKNSFYGRKHKDSTIKAMRNAKLGRRNEEANNWQGGKTALSKKVRCSGKYILWKEKVLKRDNYVCQECGSSVNLEVHHIYRFKDIVDKYRIENTEQAEKCSELWDLNNGVVLCNLCHQKTK